MTFRSLALALLALSSCAWDGSPSHVKEAEASLKGAPGTKIEGVVHFKEVDGGVEITAKISGLTPGPHGFHIHENGLCAAPDFASAGGHFNPTKQAHGSPDSEVRHVGDLGNILADDAGDAIYHRVDKLVQLNGPDSIIGKGVIVHEKADDFETQPTGNAGGRVACGVVIAK
jgi:Cu-Zn family superoxide dismutase